MRRAARLDSWPLCLGRVGALTPRLVIDGRFAYQTKGIRIFRFAG